jgi:hypothetical protein
LIAVNTAVTGRRSGFPLAAIGLEYFFQKMKFSKSSRLQPIKAAAVFPLAASWWLVKSLDQTCSEI